MSGKGFLARRKWNNEITSLLLEVKAVYGPRAYNFCYRHSIDCDIHTVSPRKCMLYGLAEWMEKEGWYDL